MSTTEPTTAKPATITTELKVKWSTETNADMNAVDFRSKVDLAIEYKKRLEQELPKGAVVSGTITIGKQKMKL